MKKFRSIVGLGIVMVLLCACGGGSSDSVPEPEGPDPTPKPYLSILPSTKTVSSAAGEFTITVSCNTAWEAEALCSWISLPESEGDKGGSVTIRYEASTVASRSGEVEFRAEGTQPIRLKVIQGDKTFTNPLGGVPDPWIIQHDGWYYLCKAHGDGINISRSKQLSVLNSTQTIWSAPRDENGVKPWNTSHVWAPELHRVDGKWYIYYTAGRPSSETGGHYYKQRSGVLRARTDDPFGEWEDMGMLYTGDSYVEGGPISADNTAYAIDLTVLELNGQLYAIWSGAPSTTNDSNQSLYIARMSDPCTISSNRVCISQPDQPWEQVSSRINEGPAILKRNGKIFVVYSCNGSWTKYYRLGYIVLDETKDPMDPANWTKSPAAVFYRCDDTADRDGVNGVGHCSFTKSPDGTEDWIVYHVKNRNDNSYTTGRSTFIQRFGWNADGTPNFGSPVGWGEPVVVPSGEE